MPRGLPDADRNLGAKVSQYLADEIANNPRIEIMTHSEVRELRGDQSLAAVVTEDNTTGARTDLAVRTLFVFIGPSLSHRGSTVLSSSIGTVSS